MQQTIKGGSPFTFKTEVQQCIAVKGRQLSRNDTYFQCKEMMRKLIAEKRMKRQTFRVQTGIPALSRMLLHPTEKPLNKGRGMTKNGLFNTAIYLSR